ncbi:hypothetical protein BT69DRAFT_1352019 [Atractiella rhizophila]|nr:hypothetical protein BT69DRAFT_1352019 [Atractiella rhizophila]
MSDLPSYSPAAPSAQSLSLPQSFSVANRPHQPFVHPPAVLAHLRLLGAFHALRQSVEANELHEQKENLPTISVSSSDGGASGAVKLPQELLWSLFLHQAVSRFQLWSSLVLSSSSSRSSASASGRLEENQLPPIDVLLVWHAYLLNPWTYWEDCLTRARASAEAGEEEKGFEGLRNMGGMEVETIAKYIDLDTFQYNPPTASIKNWTTLTKTAFEAEVPLPSSKHTIDCPSCSISHSIPYVSPSGTGWAQNFAHSCSCGLNITKSTYGLLTLAHTVSSYLLYYQSRSVSKQTPIPLSACLAGTVLGPGTGEERADRAERTNEQWMRPFTLRFAPGVSGKEIAEKCEWKWEEMEAFFIRGMLGDAAVNVKMKTPKTVVRLLRAYKEPFGSLELVGAVNRQFEFVRSLHSIHWLDPRKFETDQTTLVLAIARYHAWIDLMSSASVPGGALVPTLDIDLVWHTHMLDAKAYREQLLNALGRIPNHDDRIEENALSNAFEQTAKAWMGRFGVPYTTCGCVLPEGEQTLSSKLKDRFKSSKTQPIQPKDSLIHLAATTSSPASHPSEHNGIRVLSPSQEAERKKRKTTIEKVVAKEEKAVNTGKGKGKGDRWMEERERKRKEGHANAFFRQEKGTTEFWGVNTPRLVGFAYGLGLAGCGNIVDDADGIESAGSQLAPLTGGNALNIGGTGAGCAAGGGGGG